MKPTQQPIEPKKLIVIEERPEPQQEQTEQVTPQITMEYSNEPMPTGNRQRLRWYHWLTLAVGMAVLTMGTYVGWRAYSYFYRLGVPISVSPAENISKLQQPADTHPSAIVLTHDSVLGVALNFYRLDHVEASLSFTEPDTTDTSVLLYSRSADLTADGKPLGSLVVDGNLIRQDRLRIGYCAMANGRMVIGVARRDQVRTYCEAQGGDFFRQFVLVSNGVLPGTFLLHGKVERRALGRMADDTYYYIETRHRETLWDFADALREYGFVDAIYITGGATPTWYRSPDGARHPLGSNVETSSAHLQGKVPWLVFRKMKK